jgi:branched-chain amino acid aminotransferase
MNTKSLIYIDGRFVGQADAKVSVFDQGVLFGDGVFEGIRAYNGRVFKLDEHIERLYQGAKVLLLDVPLKPAEMKSVVVETCARNGISDGYIRLVVTRGASPHLGLFPLPKPRPTVFCIATGLSLYPEETYEHGMPIITAVQRRNRATGLDPQVKSLNYLNNILAKAESVRAGVPEALMLTEEGFVAECTGDNIFIVKAGRVHTPPVHVGILNGITRRVAIRLAGEFGLSVSENLFTLFNVYTADECFLTGSAAEIVPVRSIDGRTIGQGIPGPVTRTIARAFREYARNHGTAIEAGREGAIS